LFLRQLHDIKSTGLVKLEQYLSVKPEHYAECIGELTRPVACSDGLEASLRYHYVLPDGDGQPKFQHLAEMLVAYIINYCFSAKKLQFLTPFESSKLFMQARDLFRKYEQSGQPGEVLIYFLLEAVLSATQVLQKMPISTNPGEERKGSDGVHAKWNPDRQLLDVFFSESKLYKDFGDALRDTFKSIETFHATPMRKHEYFLTTHQMQLLDPAAQEELTAFFTGKPGKQIRTNHACLIGFDWEEYRCLDDDRRAAFLVEFEQRYLAEAERIRDKIEERLSGSGIKHFRFHFFIVPFKSVEDFRAWFLAALVG
jgi:uncharacterized protein DUF1837